MDDRYNYLCHGTYFIHDYIIYNIIYRKHIKVDEIALLLPSWNMYRHTGVGTSNKRRYTRCLALVLS